MRAMTREEILRAAKALPPKERLDVAREIVLSAEEEGVELSEADWNAAWGAEAERRLIEIEEGKVRELSAEEVNARVRAILGS
jgi:putative addiction module component (TIGR02574 family)